MLLIIKFLNIYAKADKTKEEIEIYWDLNIIFNVFDEISNQKSVMITKDLDSTINSLNKLIFRKNFTQQLYNKQSFQVQGEYSKISKCEKWNQAEYIVWPQEN